MLCTIRQENQRKREYRKEPKASLPQFCKAFMQFGLQKPGSDTHCCQPYCFNQVSVLLSVFVSSLSFAMANSIFRLGYRTKAFHVLGLSCFMLLMIQKGYAREFTVHWGLDNGTSAENYNQWAEQNRFQIGDSLLFVYVPNNDSVLHVTEEAYKNCSVEAPISSYTDGHTVFSLSQSGPYYFISGKQENCQRNEKLVVVVLADRSNHSSATNDTNPPSPQPSGSVNVIPSPAPSAESPPTGTQEISPTPAPSEESNPPNAASSVFMSVTGSIGAFVASTLLLAY